ncbi:MAG: hypothetical protein Q4C30_05995 [Bacteroidia bacterium]|nr:hypothetical protein [Bacteroidia bacterium]
MLSLSNIISLFAVAKDEDISTDEMFRQSFLNVVNFFLLVYSFIVGVHALMYEIGAIAIINFAAAVFFLSYFVFAYLIKNTRVYNAIDRIVVFLYFVIVLISSSVTRFCTVTLLMYPFLAIILHGRKIGMVLSVAQIVVAVVLYLILQAFFPYLGLDYTLYEISSLFVLQIVGTFVFLVAIRWLSEIIYDKIREVILLSEDMKVQKELIEHLTQIMRISIHDVEKCSKRMSDTNLTQMQSQLLSTIRVSVGSMNQKLDSILTASEHCIRPLGEEDVVFNLHTLVSTTLMLYGTNANKMQQGHSVVLSSEMPQQVMGNSIVTKQILLSIFDALDHKIGLKDKTLVVTLSLCDTNVQTLVVNFAITINMQMDIDHRDLNSVEAKLINALALIDAKRLIDATNSNFAIEHVSNMLSIQFTQPYKDVDAIVLPDADLLEEKRTYNEIIQENRMALSIRDMSMLIVSFDEITDRLLLESFLGRFGKVEVAASARSALNRFENSTVDVIVLSMSQYYEMSPMDLVRKIREIEQGVGRKVIIIALDSEQVRGETKLEAMQAGVDIFAHYPKDITRLHEIIKDTIDN